LSAKFRPEDSKKLSQNGENAPLIAPLKKRRGRRKNNILKGDEEVRWGKIK